MSDAKFIRGQLRQVVKETLTEEMVRVAVDEIERKLLAHLDEEIKKINDRQKDLLAFILRSQNQK